MSDSRPRTGPDTVRTLRDACSLAVGTLTTWRVSPPGRIDTTVAGTAMTIAPLVMLPLVALLAAGTAALVALDAPPAVAAVLAVAAHVLSTRGMHLDGLADTADGLSASYDRDKALAVMKTGDTGPSGVAAITLALIAQVAALTALYEAGVPGLAVAAAVLVASRGTLAWGCRRGWPAASPSGLGATVGGSVPAWALAVAGAMLLACGGGVAHLSGAPWWAGVLPVLAVAAGNGALLQRTRSRLGGITGDVLGAGIEIGLSAGLLAAALLLG